jgi:hypothetical protein
MRALALLLVLALEPVAYAGEPSIDPDTGLVVAPGWELVRANCGACHSYRLVTAQRGDAAFWTDAIRWMQRTQNLWQFPPEVETPLVAYLADHYNETDWGRRPPLSPSLMPEVP